MIKVGDRVKRNDIPALYNEDFLPDDMDFNQVYVVKAIYNKSDSLLHGPSVIYRTAELEGLAGEINLDLVKSIKSTSEERREQNFRAELDKSERDEIYLKVTHNGRQWHSLNVNHREMEIIRELLTKELELYVKELVEKG